MKFHRVLGLLISFNAILGFASLKASSSTLDVKETAEQALDDIVPGLVSRNLKIKVKSAQRGKLPIYEMVPFTGADVEKNHWDSREGAVVKHVVLHYSAFPFVGTIAAFTNGVHRPRLSAHYIVSEDEKDIKGGMVVQIVPESEKARGAGVSWWGGTDGLNATSIQIEQANLGFLRYSERLVKQRDALLKMLDETQALNEPFKQTHSGKTLIPGDEIAAQKESLVKLFNAKIEVVQDTPDDYQWFPFDLKQVVATGALCQYLKETYKINDCDFVGHDDITVHRSPSQGGPKQDPGILYPWGFIHEKFGVGAWLTESERTKESIVRLYKPEEDLPATVDVAFMARYFNLYGYKVEANATLEDSAFKNALKSFRAHFSHNQGPSAYKVEIDEQDMFWIWALVAKYGPYNARRVFE